MKKCCVFCLFFCVCVFVGGFLWFCLFFEWFFPCVVDFVKDSQWIWLFLQRSIFVKVPLFLLVLKLLKFFLFTAGIKLFIVSFISLLTILKCLECCTHIPDFRNLNFFLSFKLKICSLDFFLFSENQIFLSLIFLYLICFYSNIYCFPSYS